MGTRCTINFVEGKRIVARIYRHWDGYPESVGPDLAKFFAQVEADTHDTRYGDASYLAAKFLVWSVLDARSSQGDMPSASSKNGTLNFLGFGIVSQDPGDIEFSYYVDCADHDTHGRPKVSVRNFRSEPKRPLRAPLHITCTAPITGDITP